MGIIELISGFFKFFDHIVGFIKLLQDTPAEKRQKAISASFDAMRKFKEGDTSDVEDIFNA